MTIRTKLVAGAAITAFAVTGALAQTSANPTGGNPQSAPAQGTPAQTPSAAGAGAAPDTTNQRAAGSLSASMFAQKAAMSNQFEIESSRIAADKARSAEVKKFARMMVDDHTKAGEKFRTALRGSNAVQDMPTASMTQLDPPHRQMIGELQRAEGMEFDRVYIDMQTKAHEEAVTLFRNYSQTGDDPKLKAFATETLPTLETHLEQVKKLAAPT